LVIAVVKDETVWYGAFAMALAFVALLLAFRSFPCKECGGTLEDLDTRKGDPEGIRNDLRCIKCGAVHGMTKGTYFVMKHGNTFRSSLPPAWRAQIQGGTRVIENREDGVNYIEFFPFGANIPLIRFVNPYDRWHLRQIKEKDTLYVELLDLDNDLEASLLN
jgi:hypothetical protein